MNLHIDTLFGFEIAGKPRPVVWNGIRIVESFNVPGRKVAKRVRGGYLNHWLIRVEVMHYDMLHDRVNDCVYVHPSQMPALRKALGYPPDRSRDVVTMVTT